MILYSSFIYQENCTLEDILCKYMCACGIIFYEHKVSAKITKLVVGMYNKMDITGY